MKAFFRWAWAAAIFGAATNACDARTASPDGGAGATGAACGATPTQLGDFHALAAQVGAQAVGATALAVDSTSVYFVFNDTLMSVPIGGGSVVTMLRLPVPSNQLLQLAPVVSSTNVLLNYPAANGSDMQIVSVPIQGGGPANLTTSNGPIAGFGADEQSVYFVDQDGVKSVPVAGGSVVLLSDQITAADVTGFGGALAVVGSNLVATSAAQGGSVVAVPLQGGTPTTLAMQQPNASFPMPCGSDTCWWTGPSPGGAAGTPGPGAIARLDPAGNVTTLPQAPFFPWSLVFDGTDFFESVGCDACDGSLVRIPAAGGPAVPMGTGSFVAVDDSCAYWSTSAGISSAAKSYAP